jgi:hypothetical protein
MWNEPFAPDSVRMSPPHKHEFGIGYDMHYVSNGKVVGQLHGLKPEEAQVLAQKYDITLER